MTPQLCRWTIVLASRIVPRRTRAAWRAHWETGLDNWCILVDRGDLTMRSSGEICRSSIASAWCERFDRVPFIRALRGPVIVPAAALVAFALIALISGAFRYTRTIPLESDRILGHVFILSFSLVTAVVLVVIRGARLNARGWKCRVYLALKTFLVLLALTMFWIEGGAWLRTLPRGRETSALLGGVLWSLLYISAFVWTAGWCFADQHRRCPVCLRRLISPVSMGRWSSVFEPATTELVCEDGHGLLSVPDSEADHSAQWTNLDATWKGL